MESSKVAKKKVTITRHLVRAVEKVMATVWQGMQQKNSKNSVWFSLAYDRLGPQTSDLRVLLNYSAILRMACLRNNHKMFKIKNV